MPESRLPVGAPGLVSAVIPVHDRPRLLVEAVESVLAQSYRPIEVIVVDDGSTDETPQVAERLARQHRDVRVLRRPNGGPGLAREAGRLEARGEFIQYLDSDDLLMPEKFTTQVEALRRHPERQIAYGKIRRIRLGDGAEEDRFWETRFGDTVDHLFPRFLAERVWGTSSPLYRREICDAVGPWTGLRNEEDWEYDCRAAALGARAIFCDLHVADQRIHGGERLSSDGSSDSARLADRARARKRIYDSARRAGLEPETPEMQHFARYAFLLARQCGAAGLAAEAEDLFELSRLAAGPSRGAGFDYRVYRGLASLLGWPLMGRVSCWSDRLRRARRAAGTCEAPS